MGCGRTGALVADQLDASGHSVSIIDPDPEAFDRLSDDFSGQRVRGSGFDRTALTKAQVQSAYAFAAISDSDNSNIIATRTVAEEFGVEHVVARVADPARASLFERMGIPTVASATRIGAAILTRLLPPNAAVVWEHPAGMVSLVEVRPGPGWYGVSFREVEEATGGRIVFVGRLSEVVVANGRMVVQKEDELYIGIRGIEPHTVRDILESDPEQDEK